MLIASSASGSVIEMGIGARQPARHRIGHQITRGATIVKKGARFQRLNFSLLHHPLPRTPRQ